jgi:hypothetical protein
MDAFSWQAGGEISLSQSLHGCEKLALLALLFNCMLCFPTAKGWLEARSMDDTEYTRSDGCMQGPASDTT